MTERAIHVLHVVPTLAAGGVELAMARIVRELAPLGIRHSLCVLRGDAHIADRFAADVKIHCLHSRPNELALPWRLRALLREVRPSVIHARNWSAWPDVGAARLLTRPRIPLIFSFHGLDAAGVMPWRRRVAARLLARCTTRIFTVSAESKRFLCDHVGLAAERIAIVPNGVDTERFSPGPPRGVRPALVIGTVGSLTAVKNQELLLRAGAALHAAGQAMEIRIAGSGPLEPALRALAAQLGIAQCVHLAGAVTDVPAFLRDLDVFVLCSKSEALPNALLEAMACGLPCIATRVGGIPEVLLEGQAAGQVPSDGGGSQTLFGVPPLGGSPDAARACETLANRPTPPKGGTPNGLRPNVMARGNAGVVVPNNDLGALQSALADLGADPERRTVLGHAARQRVLADYSLRQMVALYAGMYRDVSAGVLPEPWRNIAVPARRGAGQGPVDGGGSPLVVPPSGGSANAAQTCQPPARSPTPPEGGTTNDPPPRVVMLGPLTPPVGGMATVMHDLQAGTLGQHCRLTVLNTGKTTPEGRPLVAGLWAQAKLAGQLAWAFGGSPRPIVHVHTCSFTSFWRDSLHLLLARLLRCPQVVHIHGAVFDQFIAGLRPLGRWWLRQTLTSAAAVIVLSDAWQEKLRPAAPRARWFTVANGINVPARLEPHTSPRCTFLFLGNLGQRKGARDLITAAGDLPRRGLDVHVALAGGPTLSGEKEALAAQIEKLGCQDVVTLAGILLGPAKAQALAAADCLVLPSYDEGLPMAVLEGMAYGLPVISTVVGALPEVITDGVEGFLLKPGDTAALAERMAQLAADPALRRQMGQAARARVLANYTADVMVRRIMEVYEAILASGGSGSKVNENVQRSTSNVQR